MLTEKSKPAPRVKRKEGDDWERETGAELFLHALAHLVQIVIHLFLNGLQQLLLSLAQPTKDHPSITRTSEKDPVLTGAKKLNADSGEDRTQKKKKKPKKNRHAINHAIAKAESPSSSSPKSSPRQTQQSPETEFSTPFTESEPDNPASVIIAPLPQQLGESELIIRTRSQSKEEDPSAFYPLYESADQIKSSPKTRRRGKSAVTRPVCEPRQGIFLEPLPRGDKNTTDSGDPRASSPPNDSALPATGVRSPKRKIGSPFRNRAAAATIIENADPKKPLSNSRGRPGLRRAATVMDGLLFGKNSDECMVEPDEDEALRRSASSESGTKYGDQDPSIDESDEARKKLFPRRALGAFTKKASYVLLPTRRPQRDLLEADTSSTSSATTTTTSSSTSTTGPPLSISQSKEEVLSPPPSPTLEENSPDMTLSGGYSLRRSRRRRRRSLGGTNDSSGDKIVLPDRSEKGEKPVAAAVAGIKDKDKKRKSLLATSGSPPSPIVIPRYLLSKTKKVFAPNDGFSNQDTESEESSSPLADRMASLDADWVNFLPLLDNEGDVEEELDEESEQLRTYKADLHQLEEICWRLICGEGDFKRGTNRTMLHKHVTCFSGSDLVTWIFTDVGSASRSEASALGQRLLDEKLIHNVFFENLLLDSQGVYYRLMWDSKIAAKCHNACKIWRLPPRNATVVVQELNETLNALLDKFWSKALGGLNIDELKASKMYYQFCLATAELQRVNIANMSSEEVKVFFTNVYNILFTHGQLARGDLAFQGPFVRSRFYSETSYILRTGIYSLNDIQHGILRGDDGRMSRWKGHSRWVKGPDSPKWKSALTDDDPRLHFVLIGGSVSKKWIADQGVNFVPLITLENLETQLTQATQAMIEEEVDFGYAKKEIYLPKVFKWYANDFGQTDEEVLGFLLRHYPEGSAERNSVAAFLSRGRFTIKYKQFNWASLGIGSLL